MNAALPLLAPLFAALLTGCIAVPTGTSDDRTRGKVITHADIRFIVPGRTMRTEVVEKLGADYREVRPGRALAYSWETPAIGWAWGVLIILPPGGIIGGNHHDSSNWRALFVECDSSGRVTRTEFINLASHKSLDEQLENWALKRGAHPVDDFLETGGGLFNPKNGAPQFLEALK